MNNTYFAILDSNNIVTQVVVISPEEVQKLPNKSSYIQTSIDGSINGPNYAGIGYTWNSIYLAFIPVKTFPSWVLSSTYTWIAPVTYPNDGNRYYWNETTLSWVLVLQTTNISK